MVDPPRVPPTHRRDRRGPAALFTSATVLAYLCLAPGVAVALDSSDPNTWEARPYSPLPWSAVGAPGGAVSLSFAGDGGGLRDAAGAGTGFTTVQPAETGSPYFVPGAISVADGALMITSGAPGTASQQNVLGVGVAAADRITRVTVAVKGPIGSGGRAGIWFGATEGNRIELVLEAPAEGAGGAVTLIERRAGAVTQSSTVAVPSGPVTLELVIDAAAATATGSFTSAAGELAVGALAGVSTSLVDGSLLDNSTRPADSTVTAMSGVLAVGATQTDGAPTVFAVDDFTVADLTPAPAPAPEPAPAPVETPAETPSPTPAPAPAPTATPTPSPSPTTSASPTPKPAPSAPSAPPTPNASPSPSPTSSPSPSPSPSEPASPSPTSSPSPSPSPSEPASPTPAPTRPQAPSDLRIAPSGPANDLTWSASRSDRIVGYDVETAASADGPWTPLTIDPTSSLAFRDLSPAVPGATFYRVTATDARGSVSEPAGPVSFTRSAPIAAAPSAAPEEGAPLLVVEPMPSEVELESVLFFGNPEPVVEGGGLVFGVAEVPATSEVAMTGIDGLGSTAGDAALANVDGTVGTVSIFDGVSDPAGNVGPTLLRADPVVVGRPQAVDYVQKGVDGIGVLAIAVLAAFAVLSSGRGIRRAMRSS